MDIRELASLFHSLCDKKFKPMTSEQRLLAIMRQLADASGALAKRDGVLIDHGHRYGHEDVPHRIACIIPDVLILAIQENVDLDAKMAEIITWFKSP